MAQLTANQTLLDFSIDETGDAEYGLDASAVIYAKALCGFSSGNGGTIRQLVAADTFCGIAKRAADNSGTANALGNTPNIGNGDAGDCTCAIATQGRFFWSTTITGLTGVAADIGSTVYASDSATLTTTSSGNSVIGKVVGVSTSAAGTAVFEIVFESLAERSL